MDTTIRAAARSETGKGWARKSRAAGRLPGVVYGQNHEPRPVEITPAELVDLFKKTRNRNTVVELKIDDEDAVPCLVREVQRHPVSRKILHVDFYAVPQDREIEVMVPLRPVGKPKAAALGGRLRLIRRKVRAMCRYDAIPEAFDCDVSQMEIGDMYRASDIPLPEGVKLAFDHDYNVITVYGKKRGAAAPAGAAAAAPAAGAPETPTPDA